MSDPEVKQYSFELRSGATLVGAIASLPAGRLGLWAGTNMMTELIGDESIAEIKEARATQDEAVLREHTADILGYFVGTAVVTLVAMTTAYGFTKNRALKKWSSPQSNNTIHTQEVAE